MAEPYQYVETSGVIVPDTSEILDGVGAEYRATFGQDLSLRPETPQGILVASEAVARAAVVRNNVAVANQINPNIAGGIFLDAIMALTGLQRPEGLRTFVPGVVLTGIPGTIIPAGVQARAEGTNDLFESISTVILDIDGAGTASFQSVEYGPIPANVGTLTLVVDTVLGWETVNNPIEATLGSLELADAPARDLRRNTLALQGVSLPEAITSALYATDGVRGVQFRENVTGATLVIDGVTLVEHSVWAVVDGGTDQDVALALLENKSGGANWNGPVTVPLVDQFSGQTYSVKFQRPTLVPVLVRVTIKRGTSSAEPQDAVRKAVLAYAAGEVPGEPGFRVGLNVSPFEIAAAVNYFQTGFFINKVEVAPASTGVFTTAEIELDLWEKATTTAGSIIVTVLP